MDYLLTYQQFQKCLLRLREHDGTGVLQFG